MAKVPKIVKEELQKIPELLLGFAQVSQKLSKDCSDLSESLKEHIDQLKTED